MQIGAHVSSAGGIDKAIDRAVEIGADSVQVFTQSPRAWRPTNHDPASFDRFREKRAEAGKLDWLDASRLFNGETATSFTDLWHFPDPGHELLVLLDEAAEGGALLGPGGDVQVAEDVAHRGCMALGLDEVPAEAVPQVG